MTDPPIVTGAELVAHLAGNPDPAACDQIASATSDALAVEVDPPDVLADGTVDPAFVWPDYVRRAGLMAAADVYKAGAAPGGGYAMDEFTTVEFRVTSNWLRKYEALYNPHRAIGGMVS